MRIVIILETLLWLIGIYNTSDISELLERLGDLVQFRKYEFSCLSLHTITHLQRYDFAVQMNLPSMTNPENMFNQFLFFPRSDD